MQRGNVSTKEVATIPKITKLRMMKRDSVKSPGTLVRIGAKPEAVPEARATPTSCSTEEIFLCVLPFYCMPAQREKVNQHCFCEGCHKRWAHTHDM